MLLVAIGAGVVLLAIILAVVCIYLRGTPGRQKRYRATRHRPVPVSPGSVADPAPPPTKDAGNPGPTSDNPVAAPPTQSHQTQPRPEGNPISAPTPAEVEERDLTSSFMLDDDVSSELLEDQNKLLETILRELRELTASHNKHAAVQPESSVASPPPLPRAVTEEESFLIRKLEQEVNRQKMELSKEYKELYQSATNNNEQRIAGFQHAEKFVTNTLEALEGTALKELQQYRAERFAAEALAKAEEFRQILSGFRDKLPNPALIDKNLRHLKEIRLPAPQRFRSQNPQFHLPDFSSRFRKKLEEQMDKAREYQKTLKSSLDRWKDLGALWPEVRDKIPRQALLLIEKIEQTAEKGIVREPAMKAWSDRYLNSLRSRIAEASGLKEHQAGSGQRFEPHWHESQGRTQTSGSTDRGRVATIHKVLKPGYFYLDANSKKTELRKATVRLQR